MFDLDPRDFDSRDRDNDQPDPSRGGRAGDDTREHDAQPHDPRDVPLKRLDLPRGPDRELVRVQERVYELNGRQSRALATVGAFRVVRSADIRDSDDARDRDLHHIRDQGLVKSVPLGGKDRDVVVLTREGRQLLEAHRRDDASNPRQEFYEGLRKPREVNHDAAVYRAYRRAAERLQDEGARLDRIVLDYELKREYQQFLQEENRDRPDSDGRPRRDEEEVEGWARDHGLPYFDDQVHFPDVRIKYEDRDGRSRHEDIEVITPHYRGAHAAASARAGFTCYCTIGGRAGGRSGGRPWDPRLAEEFI